ncbi:tetratricopeptide repeat protein [Mesorhizobium sp. IMUNJ 23232]|uniref:tetratricopeptide repeat protein n=1 Tax=Mesorhizobium sp. IMUNJ 23232 TaxID=3376064 RepID=UPI0037B49627
MPTSVSSSRALEAVVPNSDEADLATPSFLLLRSRNSDKLVIFFSGTNRGDGNFDFWGYANEARARYNCLLVNNGATNIWYQNGIPGLGGSVEATVASIKRIAADIGARHVYCVGASMGGSGAVLYGCLVGAKILAFSFETKVRGPGRRSSRYISSATHLPYPDLLELMKERACSTTAVFGESDAVDLREALRLRRMAHVKLITLRGVDHAIPRYLRKRHRLKPLLDAFLADEVLPSFEEADDGLASEEFVNAQFKAHCRLFDRKDREGLEAAQLAVNLRPTSDHARYLLGKALVRHENFQEALCHLGASLAMNPNQEEARQLFGVCLRKLGRHAHAIEFHRETVRMWPDFARPIYDIGLAYLQQNNRTEAIAAFKRACELAPNDRHFANKLATLTRSK